jgi:hypothetical protein
MDRKYYTKEGDHPEDAIFRVAEFIQELTKVQDEKYNELVKSLGLNSDGDDFLFDYIFNTDREITFDEYIINFGKKYSDLVVEDTAE